MGWKRACRGIGQRDEVEGLTARKWNTRQHTEEKEKEREKEKEKERRVRSGGHTGPIPPRFWIRSELQPPQFTLETAVLVVAYTVVIGLRSNGLNVRRVVVHAEAVVAVGLVTVVLEKYINIRRARWIARCWSSGADLRGNGESTDTR